jgi:hypothetical protein
MAVEKSGPKVWANSAIFKKLGIPLERNHPIGEN